MATETLGATVRKVREAKQLTLRDLAKQTNLSYQTVHRIERGEGSVRAANVVLAALGLPSRTRERLLFAHFAA